MDTLRQLAMEAAAALKTEWMVGSFGPSFCDEPPDWDSADEEAVAVKLMPFLRRAKKRKTGVKRTYRDKAKL